MPKPLLITLLLCFALAVPAVLHMWYWRLTPLQAFLLLFNRLLNRLLWHTKINRPLPVARGAGALIIANHRSSFDPMFIAIGTHRLVHWMVANEYTSDWRFGWFFRGMGAIPANRSGIDSASTKRIIRTASSGHLVGMMPEGRINESEQLLMPGRPGAALVALKARVPVIPCYIHGAPYGGTPMGPFMRRAHVRVTVGDPLDLSEFYDREGEEGVLQELTKRFLIAIAHLAGDDNFVPQLAGRRWKPNAADEAAPAG